MTRHILTILAFLVLGKLCAQDTLYSLPMTWGEVPSEHWEMTSYEGDPQAEAVILCDYGERDLSLAMNKQVRLYRLRRIKILTEAGLDFADQTLPFLHKHESIKDFQAQTLNLENGKLEILPLKESDFALETLDEDWSQWKFFLPKVKVGSIIEIRYTLVEKQPHQIRPWEFQTRIPVLHSELKFTRIANGTFMYTNITTGMMAKKVEFTNKSRWVLKDIPAWNEVPFLINPGEYRTRIRFQLKSAIAFTAQGYRYSPMFDRWDQLQAKLTTYLTLKKGGKAKKIFKSIIPKEKGVSPAVEKNIQYYYEKVRDHFKWNEERSIFPERESLTAIYESRTGNSAEINLFLYQILKEAGFNAYPLLISTRSRGKTLPQYPLISQFNHLIVFVETTSGHFFLDATDRHRPYNMLDTEDLNGRAWVMDQSNPQRWVRIPPPLPSGIRREVKLSLAEEGKLMVQVEEEHQGYFAVSTRRLLENSANDFWESEVKSQLIEGELTAHQVFDLEDCNQPLRLSYSVVTSDYLNTVGEVSYLRPLLWWEKSKNPFPAGIRRVPIEFSYPYLHQFQIDLQLPKEYVVEELPEAAPHNFITSFKYAYSQPQPEKVSLFIQHGIGATTITAGNYEILRKGYDEIITRYQAPIVLKKR